MQSLEITLDAVDVEGIASFWSAALGCGYLYRRDPYIVLGATDDAGPRVVIQRVPRRPATGGSVHLDLRVDSVQQEVDRLAALGARVVHEVEEAGKRWTVMIDPEGARFCVCPARRTRTPPDALTVTP